MSDNITRQELEELNQSRVVIKFRRWARSGWDEFVERSGTVAEARQLARDARVGWRRNDHLPEGTLKYMGVVGTMTQIDLAKPEVYDRLVARLDALHDDEDPDPTETTDAVQNAVQNAPERPTGQCKTCRFRRTAGGCWFARLLLPLDYDKRASKSVEDQFLRSAAFGECLEYSPGRPTDDTVTISVDMSRQLTNKS